MILSDKDIKSYIKSGRILIEPKLKDEQYQSAWVDLTLGNEFRIFKSTQCALVDPKKSEDITELISVNDEKPFIIHPGEFVLGAVNEYVKFPDDLAGAVDGRSSLGRLGVVVHITSTFVDPGWEGKLVLEITNVGKMPVALYPGMRICKLVFMQLSSPCERPYYMKKDAKYLKQDNVDQSKIQQEFSRKA
ncbi:MAG: dCTP deaminase [Candidatus Aenigmatarchaeota archaeon]